MLRGAIMKSSLTSCRRTHMGHLLQTRFFAFERSRRRNPKSWDQTSLKASDEELHQSWIGQVLAHRCKGLNINGCRQLHIKQRNIWLITAAYANSDMFIQPAQLNHLFIVFIFARGCKTSLRITLLKSFCLRRWPSIFFLNYNCRNNPRLRK